MLIPFNKPYLTGKEADYIEESLVSRKLSGDGAFTRKCHIFFEKKYGFKKCLLTASCTDALEMAAILINIQPGDEVIIPSFTFVSTANAFMLRGARIIFADSRPDHPGIDVDAIEPLITDRTIAIVPVHYAGVACDMDRIMELADKFQLFVIEDAAQAIDSFYTGKDGVKKPLGSIGHLGTFSFHETKNIMSGEGGMLVINDNRFLERSEIIREKGTNRTSFFRGEVDKYGWVDIGSSFLPSDITAAFLYAQIERLDEIQSKRIFIWNYYYKNLIEFERDGKIRLPTIPEYSSNNAHMFYIIAKNGADRARIIESLRAESILSVFHYLSLHKSEFFKSKYFGEPLFNSDHYSDCLIRLPMFVELEIEILDSIIKSLRNILYAEIN